MNTGLISDPAVPFGGVKESGQGREGARLGVEEYLEVSHSTGACIGKMNTFADYFKTKSITMNIDA